MPGRWPYLVHDPPLPVVVRLEGVVEEDVRLPLVVVLGMNLQINPLLKILFLANFNEANLGPRHRAFSWPGTFDKRGK